MGSNLNNNKAEEIWVKNIQNGDHQAFEALFNEYYFKLTRFAWRYVESKAIAEGIVQEVFADIWEDRISLDISGSLRSFLYTVVKNQCLDHLKHQKVKYKYEDRLREKKENPTIDFKDELREERVKEAIKKAIDDLPPRGKMTYKLHRYDGLTYEEIADVMGVSIKTVESQMTRSLKKLRESLSHLLP